MIRIALYIFVLTTFNPSFAQNCKSFLYQGDTLQYEACLIAEDRKGHYQFSRKYQQALDRAIDKCNYFSYAYRHKSTAYLKSGDFLTWKQLIDKAVELNPDENLGYRGWCRYQFFRDYEGAIKDIERLNALYGNDIGYSANGNYHLNIAKALCYKALENRTKALNIIEDQLKVANYDAGIFDYLHLGVLYLENNEFSKAIEALTKQSELNELADNQYYLAIAHKKVGNKSKYHKSLELAKKLYLNGQKMHDLYTHPYDQIYLETIERELLISTN